MEVNIQIVRPEGNSIKFFLRITCERSGKEIRFQTSELDLGKNCCGLEDITYSSK